MHVRRYAKSELISKMKINGLNIIRHGFINSLLFIPFYIKKKLNRLFHDKKSNNIKKMSDDIDTSSSNSIIRKLFDLDYIISINCKIPFGIREIILASK